MVNILVGILLILFFLHVSFSDICRINYIVSPSYDVNF